MKRRIGQHRIGVVLFAAIAVVAFTMLTGVALATGPSTESTATLTGGDLTVASPLVAGTFSGTFTGAALSLHSTNFSTFQIIDARGTGVGWQVTFKATQWTNTASSGHAQNAKLEVGSLTMPQYTGAPVGDSSAKPATEHVAAAIDTEDGVVMIACVANPQGMGTYTYTAGGDWLLAVGADEYAGTYTSTITTTLATKAL